MQLPNNITVPPVRGNPMSSRLTVPPPRPIYSPTLPGHLPGYYVSSEDDIILEDIKMDGSISFFPSKDLSRIYIRQWAKNGNLEGLTYVLQPPDPPKVADPIPVPDPVEQQPKQDTLVQTLTSLNNGLAQTFAQFGETLQNMQNAMQGISSKIDNLSDGGMG